MTKKGNPQPLLDYKVSRNFNFRKSTKISTEFHLFFELKPFVKEDVIHKSVNTDPLVGYTDRKVSKDHYQHQTRPSTQQPHRDIKIITTRQIKIQFNNTILDKVKIENKFKTQYL